ncbi:MAG: hydrogenase iron-sulfur subunit [Candidatus Sigynarchaeota archaeon]
MRVKCTGRVDMSDILQALRDGADGVGIYSCHKGECDFENGNVVAERHVNAVKFMLQRSGFNPDRVGQFFMSAAEIDRFLRATNEFVAKIKALPPNPLKKDRGRGLQVVMSQDLPNPPAK